MVFSSLYFLFLYLPVVLAVYYAAAVTPRAPRMLRNTILFVASLIFYAWGEPVYVVLMLFSTLVDYTLGMLIDRFRGTGRSKLALIGSVVINLALLGVFKYSDFVVANLNHLFGLGIAQPDLPLPIGISFYTFQTMSYSIDCYRGEAKVQRNIISFGAYVALFPQLIAGPIVRYQDVAGQLEGRRENVDQFAVGVRRFVAGLAKKVLLANNIGMVWSQFSALPAGRMSVLGAWIGILAFAFQIYFDFSGYSDMAIGLGKMLGFDFLENFNYPYVSKSVTEFWRRWHISLGTWFREYVYIPLGGNRRGIGRQLVNIAVVWVITGIWHGASWNFVLWGVYYCVLLILEKLFLLKLLGGAPAAVGHLYAVLMVLFGWVIFAFEDYAAGIRYFGWMFGAGGIPVWNNTALFALLSNILLLAALGIASTPLASGLSRRFFRLPFPVLTTGAGNLALALLFLLSAAYLVDSTYNPFLYFRF